jgi:DHA2 family multidrug resistance protein-like MFS transporter
VLILPTLLLSLDLSVLILAIPHITADLHPSSAQSLWIVDIYGFTLAGLLATMGNLADRIGRRKLMMIGAALFSVASAVAAWSSSAPMLIAARAVLGIAGSTLMPTMLGLISTMFRNAKQRAFAISIQTSFFMVGMAIGPLVGGVMLSLFWWGSVFLLGLPVMVLLLIVAPLLLPGDRPTDAGRVRLDLISIVLSMAAVLPVVYGLKELAQGSSALVSTAVLVVGLLFGVAFVRRQRRLSDPLLDVRLLGRRAFSGALGMILIGGSAISGIILLFNQYLQLVLGFSPLHSGLWLIPYTVAMMAGYLVAPVLAHRFRPPFVIATGMIVSMVGFLLLTQASSGGLPITVIGTVLATAGLAPMLVLSIGLVIGSVPPEKAGAVGAISQTSNELGVALGIAVFGSIATIIYRGAVAVPAGVPSGVAATARQGIAQGTAAASGLSGDLAGQLITAIRGAFTSAFAGAALVCAILMVILAGLALVLFRRVGLGGEETAPAAGSAPSGEAVTPEAVSTGEQVA